MTEKNASHNSLQKCVNLDVWDNGTWAHKSNYETDLHAHKISLKTTVRGISDLYGTTSQEYIWEAISKVLHGLAKFLGSLKVHVQTVDILRCVYGTKEPLHHSRHMVDDDGECQGESAFFLTVHRNGSSMMKEVTVLRSCDKN